MRMMGGFVYMGIWRGVRRDWMGCCKKNRDGRILHIGFFDGLGYTSVDETNDCGCMGCYMIVDGWFDA